MRDENIVRIAYPKVRLVKDEAGTKFFGLWTGDDYLAISYESEQDAWMRGAVRIYQKMVKKLES
jgi:hypothetical protein